MFLDHGAGEHQAKLLEEARQTIQHEYRECGADRFFCSPPLVNPVNLVNYALCAKYVDRWTATFASGNLNCRDERFHKQLFIPLKPALPYPHAKIVRGIAEEIQDKHVVVRQTVNDQAEATTTNLPFDYLVLATGSSYTSPIKVANDE
ncbi:unnamed protein product [Aphanomyces euteiches]